MLPVFLLTLREGIEAALIIGIILAYLNRTNREHHAGAVWIGVFSAAALSIIAGALIFQVMGGFDPSIPEEKNALRLFEGVACLLAACILTWVIVWMHRNAGRLGTELRAAVDAAVDKKHRWALAGLSFVTVGREGFETILILPGLSKDATVAEVAIGSGLGLGVALVIGVLLHRGSKALNLRRFFKITGILLIFFAAGLVAYGIHELQDAGKFPILIKEIWNINHILYDKQGVGLFLKALFGYNGNPSLIEAVGYALYLGLSLTLFLKPAKPNEPSLKKTGSV